MGVKGHLGVTSKSNLSHTYIPRQMQLGTHDHDDNEHGQVQCDQIWPNFAASAEFKFGNFQCLLISHLAKILTFLLLLGKLSSHTGQILGQHKFYFVVLKTR